jgi:hypothetical protein
VAEGIVRDAAFKEQTRKTLPPVLKVPRQCPLAFLVKVHLREGEALRSEKVLGRGLCYQQRRKVEISSK